MERFGDRAGFGRIEAADAQVDDVERIDAEVPQVVVDLLTQLLGRARGRPAALRVSFRPHLRDDVQIARVRVQGLFDDLVVRWGP